MLKRLLDNLKGQFKTFYDESGSIGRRYRRQDEAGTPYCITVDNETFENDSVTIRNRDSMVQERISASNILTYLNDKLKS